MNFKEFKAKFQASLPDTSVALYQVNVPKEMMWDTFITSFPEELQPEYTCNCCRSFVRAYGNLVAIIDNKPKSIWDVNGIENTIFSKVAEQMRLLVANEPIRDVFVIDNLGLGTDNNVAFLNNAITWEHMYIELNPRYPFLVGEVNIATKRGDLNSIHQVFSRALAEITIDSLETVLDLISQNSIYRGAEYENIVQRFLTYKLEYETLSTIERNFWTWVQTTKLNGEIARFKNTAIGTLVVDIAEGEVLDTAVRKYESKVAPENYKRPTAVFTKRQVEEAEKTIAELGLTNSLGRRFAHKDDITVNEVLFVDRTQVVSGVFADLKDEVAINPKTFSKVEEVHIDEFIKNILPRVTGVEILVENQHSNKFVSLISPQDINAPTLFKWNNPFSWSYRNALADSGMKERVKHAGGNVTGVLRFSIQWNDEDTKYPYDFDAHAYEPNRTFIYYGSSYRGKRSGHSGNQTASSGNLDVDMTGGPNVMVENITWTEKSRMKDGDYKFLIHNFTGSRCNGFKAQIEMDGEVHEFFYPNHFYDKIEVATVTLRNGQFTIKPAFESKSSVRSEKIWGINTCQFHKVNMITNSPNYWGDNAIGNKHTFFFIDKVHNDEAVRGFFNEYLDNKLTPHRKVFEALGGKLKVAPSDVQVSGLGYSSTVSDEVIVKLTGTFTRTIKIKF